MLLCFGRVGTGKKENRDVGKNNDGTGIQRERSRSVMSCSRTESKCKVANPKRMT